MGPNANGFCYAVNYQRYAFTNDLHHIGGIRRILGHTDKLICQTGCGLIRRTLIHSAFNLCKSSARRVGRALLEQCRPQGDLLLRDQSYYPSSARAFHGVRRGALPRAIIDRFFRRPTTVYLLRQSGEVLDLRVCACGIGRLRVGQESTAYTGALVLSRRQLALRSAGRKALPYCYYLLLLLLLLTVWEVS